MATKFTINQDAVNEVMGCLLELSAVPMVMHEEKKDGRSNGDRTHPTTFSLSAGTTFVTVQDISRTKLTKLFGKAAMVRGVKKI